MAEHNYNHVAVPAPVSLVAIPSAGGIELRWDPQNNNSLFATEVWMAEFDDITVAKRYKTVKDNTCWVALDSGVTRFFWVRHIDKAGQTNSGFTPPTRGVSGTVPNTKLDDIDFNNPDLNFDVVCDEFNVTANALNVPYTAASTNGAQTISTLAGRVKFAASATSLVVTNANVTTDSIILAVSCTNDSTGRVNSIVPGSGSFTIYATAPTGVMSVNYLILN